MNKYELNNEAGTAVLELEKDSFKENLDDIPYEDFLYEVEKEILSEERNRENNNPNYLNDYLERIKERKENFLTKIKSEKRKLAAEILFEIEEVVIKNILEDKSGNRSLEFRIGDSEWQQEIISFVNENKDNLKELEMFLAEYKTLFEFEDDEESGNKYMAGIMAPLALQNIFEEKYSLEVSYPKPKEDVKYGIDMIATDRENNQVFLIQVKTNRNQIEKIIDKTLNKKRKEDEYEIKDKYEKKLVKVIPRFEFGDKNREMDKDYNDFSEGCLKYVNHNRDFFSGKGYETKGVYMYVPYVVRGEKFIGIDGTPTEKLWKILVAEGLEKKLGLPNKLDYGSVLKK